MSDNIRILKEGDKSQAVCSHCQKLVNTTYRCGRYTYPGLQLPLKYAENILQGFCDICGNLASIPAQSAEQLYPKH